MILGAYIEALAVGPDLGDEVSLHCNTVRGGEQSALSLWSWLALENAKDDRNCNSIALTHHSDLRYVSISYCFYGRGEKMDSRLRRSVLRTALRASVGSQARLGVNFRPLPPEDSWAFISSCYQ